MGYFFNLLLILSTNYCYSVNLNDNSESSSGLNCFGVNFKENNIELKTNVLKTDGDLEIEIVDIKGFTVINGNANAKFTMCVINSQNDTLLTFKKFFLLNPNEKFNLLTNLKISVIPYLVVYEKYTILLKVDDSASEKYLSYSFPFNIKHNSFLKTSSEVLNFRSIYLWNETKKEIIHDNILLKEEKSNVNLSIKYFLIFSFGLLYDSLTKSMYSVRESIAILESSPKSILYIFLQSEHLKSNS